MDFRAACTHICLQSTPKGSVFQRTVQLMSGGIDLISTNISFDGEIGAEAMKLNVLKRRQDELLCSRERHSILSRHFGSIEQKQFLHDASRERRAVQFAACFEKHAQHVTLAQLFKYGIQAHAAALASRLDDLHAGALELLCLDGFCRSQRENQKVTFHCFDHA